SQRDCILQPRVARNELPWEAGYEVDINPNGVAAPGVVVAATPLGLKRKLNEFTQGSSFLATLGYLTESRWDSAKRTPDLWVMHRSWTEALLRRFRLAEGRGRFSRAGARCESGAAAPQSKTSQISDDRSWAVPGRTVISPRPRLCPGSDKMRRRC